jgi:hypothetical protein
MIKYSVKTNLDREEVLDQARDFFGEKLGLQTEEESPCCLRFSVPNSIGYVYVALTSEEDEPTEVELETRDYKYQVEQFMRQIG